MGNCIPVSPSLLESRNSLLDLMELMGNFSSYDDDDAGNETSLDYGAAPCHNQYCSVFQRVAPPFLAVTSAMAALGTAALLLALAKRPQWPQSRALVAQLAMGTGLLAAVLPAVALGIGQGWRLGTALCRLMHLLWYWSLFAQGLLVASGACGRFWCRWDARSRRLAVAVWVLALLLATPGALTSGTAAVPEPSCLRRSVDFVSPVNLLHLGLCLGLFLLLPVAVPVATLAVPRWRARWAPDLAASWVFLALWVPHGAALATELLLHSRVLPQTCGTFQHFDYALGLSEALGLLHCWMGPAAVLLAARLCHTSTGTGPSAHSIAPAP
ncbi:atypical chemokine receptor 1 [Neopsephotus bourkii]|uniref:atypical chemokine receptor 1 n=1 Tax=Neopsephotus bourkii TaxID=309878 RepID=UPI002AA51ABE|nr:atypical chemokine receptor 1 [Neopsephotus bourkii]